MYFKNLAAWTAAFTIVSAGAISAAAALKSPELIHLQNVLLNRETVQHSDDVNGDGTVNVFDIMLMKRQLMAGTGELTGSDIKIQADNAKLVGRNFINDDAVWLVQSGSAAEFTINAVSAEITLLGDSGTKSEERHRPRYAVYVDGELIEDALLSESTRTVELFSGTSPRSAQVKVMLLSEASFGAVGAASVHTVSASPMPVTPIPEKPLCIEFIGDSITCAYGVEGTSSSDPFMTGTENFTKSYAYLTAQKLGADYSVVGYSGHGIVSGFSSGDKNSESLIPDCYELTSKRYGYTTPWDFGNARKNDVVVINLGTNDHNYVKEEPETRGPEFIEGYINFLHIIREKNPQAHIICTMGTMGGEDVYALIEQAVQQYSHETGDTRISCYASTLQKTADGYGADWHPSAVTHQNSAYLLADKICQALGIESDQVGLDVAENAVYDLLIDDTNGANAAFYVGYDNSFWINMVMGGSAPREIEASLSGIGLKENGTYRLEFDCTSGAEVDLPVFVRGQDVYFTSYMEADSTKRHFSEEFTVNVSDSDASIIVQVGGTDYYNVTLENIKLIKIK